MSNRSLVFPLPQKQREIKALVTKDMYEAHLAKSIRQAESKLDNTFHCKTPNCRGWCIFEDNVNQFKCPVCTIVNCLTCRVSLEFYQYLCDFFWNIFLRFKAIHDGLNCKQYQDRMDSDCDTNTDARRTKDMLQEMVDKGDALMCPTCQVRKSETILTLTYILFALSTGCHDEKVGLWLAKVQHVQNGNLLGDTRSSMGSRREGWHQWWVPLRGRWEKVPSRL